MRRAMMCISAIGILLATVVLSVHGEDLADCLEDLPWPATAYECKDAYLCGDISPSCSVLEAPCDDGCDGEDYMQLCTGKYNAQIACSESNLGGDSLCERLHGCGQKYSGTCESTPGSMTLLRCSDDMAIQGEYCDRVYCLVTP